MNEITDRDLIIRLKADDIIAFEALYNKYKFHVATNLLRLVKSETVAEDLLHDLFIKIWENKQLIDPDQSFKSYLFRIAHNMVIDFFRKAARDQKLQQHILLNSSLIYSHIEEMLHDKEKRFLLEKAMDELPPQCRLVFQLCKIEGRSYEEVSEMLQISTNTISKHLVKARKQIKALLLKEPSFTYFLLIILFYSL